MAVDVRQIGAMLLSIVLLTVVASGVAVAHGGDDGMHHHDGWMGAHDGWMGAPVGVGGVGLLWLLAWVVVLAGAGYLVYRSVGGTDGNGAGSGDDALAVLRQRYARGELDDDEFERRREQLLR